ncbi:hypothetical protein L7F22_033307 [Adiantum nelumboides]|nr:hypothetical protein [Adiantum nelumboides]
MYESTVYHAQPDERPCDLVRIRDTAFPVQFGRSSVLDNGSNRSTDGSLLYAHGASSPFANGCSSSCAANEPAFATAFSAFATNGFAPSSSESAIVPNGSSFPTNASALPLQNQPSLLPAQGPGHLHRRSASTSACAFLAEDLRLSAFPTVGSALLATVSAVRANGALSNANAISAREPAVCFALNSASDSPGSSAFSLEGLPLLTNEPNSPASTFCSLADAADHESSSGRKNIWASCPPSFSASRVESRVDSFPFDGIVVPLQNAGNSADTYGTLLAKHNGRFFSAEKRVGSQCKDDSFELNFDDIDIHDDKHAGKGVTLTWKDLWVTLPDSSKPGAKPLLQNSTGFAKPGNMMAILGPSGSGKSTLLDSLAGRLSPNLKQVGNVLVNGRRQILSYGNSAYVTQDDVLLASLTVWEAIYYSAQLQLPKTMSNEGKRKRAEKIIKEMGLQGALHTRIGGWRARGLSGGEKRRVSIAIELLTRPCLLFLDEPTSGLDRYASVSSRVFMACTGVCGAW